jgi:hypothetical protein
MANTPTVSPAECRRILNRLERFGPLLSIKLYRLEVDPRPPLPILPCLDHEAMLHQRVAPHLAAYVQDRESGDLHEIIVVPAARRLEVDTVSTWGEASPDSNRRLLDSLRSTFPDYRVTPRGPSRWRGDRRVAEAVRAQVTIRDVLLADDLDAVAARIERLQTIGSLMEKESRVASWGVRTLTGPLLAAAGVITFLGLGRLAETLGPAGVTWLRYAMLGLLGGAFVYYGMKAVQLTEMANRVWKRAAEYSLIVRERKRLRAGPARREHLSPPAIPDAVPPADF